MGRMPKDRATVRRPSDGSTAPPIDGDHQPSLTRCGVADHLLVFAAVAIMLGLSALMASLAPFAGDRGGVVLPWSTMVIDRGHAPRLAPSRDGPPWPLAGEVTPAALPWGGTGSLWSSSLQPPTDATTEAGVAHIGATASPRDPRAFLLDTAIQVHAPSSAPAPRRAAPPRPHGVD